MDWTAIVLALIGLLKAGFVPALLLYVFLKLREPTGRFLEGVKFKDLLDKFRFKQFTFGRLTVLIDQSKDEMVGALAAHAEELALEGSKPPALLEPAKHADASIEFEAKSSFRADGVVTTPPRVTLPPEFAGPNFAPLSGDEPSAPGALSPVALIVANWISLEREIRQQAARLESSAARNLRRAISVLERHGVIEETALRTIERMRHVGNNVSDIGNQVTEAAAEDYRFVRGSLVTLITASVDEIVTSRIFENLNVSTAEGIVVTRMRVGTADQSPKRRRGRWVAVVPNKSMGISEDDCRALLRSGARLVSKEEAERIGTRASPT